MSEARPELDVSWLTPGDAAAERALWRMLCAVDREFVPPLSTRESTTSRVIDVGGAPGEPRGYFAEMLRQRNVLVTFEGAFAGFMSIRPRHVDDAIAEVCPCSYISTIGVLPEHRKHGVARRLYRAVLEETPPELASRWFVTRTWSTNDAHLALLAKLGFRAVKRIADHRGPGIDSVYLAKSTGSAAAT